LDEGIKNENTNVNNGEASTDEVAYNNEVKDKNISATLTRRSVEDKDYKYIANNEKVDTDYNLEVFSIEKRTELANTTDTDGDGVTDYDEMHIYKTDHENPFTSGSVLSDGERLLLGLDPRTNGMEAIVTESPRIAGKINKELFKIEKVELVEKELSDNNVDEYKKTNNKQNSVKIVGIARPFVFVTLYVYSTPIIVTVRADEDGHFEYVLDETLEDGAHELYVASVNNSGKILAKSESVPFIKTAQAVEYTPFATTDDVTPVDSAMHTMITFSLLLMLIVSVSVIVWLGILRAHSHEEVVESS